MRIKTFNYWILRSATKLLSCYNVKHDITYLTSDMHLILVWYLTDITPLLRQLHWLCIPVWISFKLATIHTSTWKITYNLPVSRLATCCQYAWVQILSLNDITIPYHSLTSKNQQPHFCHHCYSNLEQYSARNHIHHISDCPKHKLRTCLFNVSYNHWLGTVLSVRHCKVTKVS